MRQVKCSFTFNILKLFGLVSKVNKLPQRSGNILTAGQLDSHLPAINLAVELLPILRPGCSEPASAIGKRQQFWHLSWMKKAHNLTDSEILDQNKPVLSAQPNHTIGWITNMGSGGSAYVVTRTHYSTITPYMKDFSFCETFTSLPWFSEENPSAAILNRAGIVGGHRDKFRHQEGPSDPLLRPAIVLGVC